MGNPSWRESPKALEGPESREVSPFGGGQEGEGGALARWEKGH